jgi:hypothetical protein
MILRNENKAEKIKKRLEKKRRMKTPTDRAFEQPNCDGRLLK